MNILGKFASRVIVGICFVSGFPNASLADQTFDHDGSNYCANGVSEYISSNGHLLLGLVSISPEVSCFRDQCRWEFEINMRNLMSARGYCTLDGQISLGLSYQIVSSPVPLTRSTELAGGGVVLLNAQYESQGVVPELISITMLEGPAYTWTCAPMGDTTRCTSSSERFPTLFQADPQFVDGTHNYATIQVVTAAPDIMDGNGFAACTQIAEAPAGIYRVDFAQSFTHQIRCTAIDFDGIADVVMAVDQAETLRQRPSRTPNTPTDNVGARDREEQVPRGRD